MKQIKLSKTLSAVSIVIITVLFLSVISPLKGLSIATWSLLLLAILFWITSIILLISGLVNRKRENNLTKAMMIPLLLVIAFIPIGLLYMNISGSVRTKITVTVINQSDFIPGNVLIYGKGSIFENSDTLSVKSFNKGEKLQFIIRPSTKPHKNGYINMEFDVADKHISRVIAGEFSINPYNIQQDWEITLDNGFIK